MGTHYTVTGLPAGTIVKDFLKYSGSASQMNIKGNADNHTSANNTTVKVTFLDAAFDSIDADTLPGNPITLNVVFVD